MQFIQDHLAAFLVGAALVLGLPLLALQAGESSRAASQAYAARGQLLAFVDVLDQDLSNVGAEVDPALPVVVEWTPADPGAPTTAFEFRGAVGPTADAAVERVRYTATPADSVPVAVAGQVRQVPTYRVRRLVWDGTAHRPAGGTAATLTAFEVTLLRDNTPLGPADDPETADALDIRVEAAVAPGTRGGPQTARWQSRHALVNLGDGSAPPAP